jgi:hypothetical protein
MTVVLRRLLAVAALVTGMVLGGVGPTPPPAGATNPFAHQLTPGTQSQRVLLAGCKFRVSYLNYGTIPTASIRIYNAACTDVSVRVWWVNGTTTYSAVYDGAPQISGTDPCAYDNYQVVAPTSGTIIGVTAGFNGTVRTWTFDGTMPPPPTWTCP